MLAILNYHNVAPVPAGMRMPQLYVPPEQFAHQMWWLHRLGLEGVTLSEGIRRLETGDASRCVAITFDDGYADNLLNAAPFLREHRFKATCFIVSDRVGSHNEWDAEDLGGKKPLMRADQIGGWMDLGFEVGSHTCTHRDLTAISLDEVMRELVESRATLQRLAGAPVSSFCYPWGRHCAETARCVARAGYRSAVTSMRGRASGDDDPMRLPRISVSGRNGIVKYLLKAGTPYCDLRGVPR